QPTQNAVVSGTTVNLTYTAAGDSSQVDAVYFQLDANPIITDTTFDGVHQIFDVPSGPHTLNGFLGWANAKIVGSDAAPVNFTIQLPDTTPPTVSITSPGDGSTVSGIVTVAANGSDDVGVTAVQF